MTAPRRYLIQRKFAHSRATTTDEIGIVASA